MPRTRVILVLCDALKLDDLLSQKPDGTYAYPHLVDLAQNGAIGLMNVAVVGPHNEVAGTLTLAVGQPVAAEPTDAQAANDWEPVPGEHGADPAFAEGAATVYRRRVGPLVPTASARFDPQHSIYHLGLADLARRGLDTARLGAALASVAPPVRTAVFGNADTDTPDRSAALLTVDARGIGTGLVAYRRFDSSGPFSMIDAPLELADMALEADADFVVVQVGDTARAEAARQQLSPESYQEARDAALRRLDLLLYTLTAKSRAESRPTDVLLVSPRPPAEAVAYPVPWTRLTPILATGPDFPPGLLTSATTRSPGLVANIDLAPTLLALYHAPLPPTMAGRPMRSARADLDGPERNAVVARIDYIAVRNEEAKTWVLVPLAVVGLSMVLVGLAVRKRYSPKVSRRFAPSVIFLQNLPAAVLLAPLLAPPTLLEYGLRIVAWMAGLTVACFLLARLLRLSPPVMAALLCLALLVGDTLAGQPLQKNSLLCSYAIGGIRYYGVGNEYLGVLLGFALGGSFAWLDDRRLPFPPNGEGHLLRAVLGLGWLGLALLLGWPGLGANAGSLAATGAGFGVGAAILRGRRPTWLLAVACVLGGLLLAFLFGLLEANLAGGAASHVGKALQDAAGARGPAYLAQIALRKVQMNLRLLVTPAFWLLGGAVILLFVGARALAPEAIRAVLERRLWTSRGIATVLAAAVAALLFKDSGVVTDAALLAAAAGFVLYYSLAETEGVSVPAAEESG